MKTLLKNARELKGLKTRELAQKLKIDQALISKFENGSRKPTREQISKLANVLDINFEELMIAWLKEKILYEIGDDDLAIKAMNIVKEERKVYQKLAPKLSANLSSILAKIDILKTKLDQFRALGSYKITQVLELEYTFESNRIEGNTLTFSEIDLVINQGITISGKSMREHLEVINHQEAIEHIKQFIGSDFHFNERELLTIHNLILRGILPKNAGHYRNNLQDMIKGSSHMPPQPFIVAKEMEDYFFWFEENKNKIHPVILAAEMHERLVTIHPFIDGNGRTSRLIMSLILLQNGYIIANIKGDYETRMQYYQSLETAQTSGNKEDFLMFIATVEKECLERYLNIISK